MPSAARRSAMPNVPQAAPTALEPLESLQARADAQSESRASSEGWAAHEAVLDRLAANVRMAQRHGWTSCAIERVNGAIPFSAWGVPSGDCQRHPIPDWSTEPERDEGPSTSSPRLGRHG
jgi:hypothetical protein